MLFLVVSLLYPLAMVQAGRMEVLYGWSQVDLVFTPDKTRDTFLTSEEFIPRNNIILDVDVWKDKVFVTLPKMRPGIPVTLATVSDQTFNNTRLLQPYPDWSWHQGDCDGITSVYRTQVDECGRLWVIDTGIVNSLEQFKRKCPPQILVFDLHTDKLIRRHRFPDTVLAGTNTMMITVKVDSRTPDCSDSVAYIADVRGFQLFVYDLELDKSWRIINKLFYPFPLNGHFHINGEGFDLMDGIFGLALGPLTEHGDRTLFFHSMSSVYESWVSTSVIRNHSLFEADRGALPQAFHMFRGNRGTHSAPEDMTDSGVLLYTLVEENAIGCWNSRHPFARMSRDIVIKDDVTLQFQSGLKVYGDKVWTLSSRYHKYRMNKMPEDEINYRVNVGRVSDLIKNTRCDPHRRRPSQHHHLPHRPPGWHWSLSRQDT